MRRAERSVCVLCVFLALLALEMSKYESLDANQVLKEGEVGLICKQRGLRLREAGKGQNPMGGLTK